MRGKYKHKDMTIAQVIKRIQYVRHVGNYGNVIYWANILREKLRERQESQETPRDSL
jgi:hypothetical protein